jgi:HTH-type transcriptional regulator/antitoxin HigA
MNARVPAEVFAPGEFLKEELEARGWTQQELSEILARPPRLISEIVSGKRAITPETAQGLGEAFGTGGEYWLNLESQYALSKVRGETGSIKRRAALHERFPVREMIKRGWLSQAASVEILEKQVLEFFGLAAVNDEVQFLHAAKKSSYEETPSMLQLAWLLRSKELAEAQIVPAFNESRLRQSLAKLHALLTAPEEARHVPTLLRECGVRYVLVEALPGSKIDGACYWLSDAQPVIAMSLRFDRIDNFWFVLRHEIEHVLRGDARDAQYVIDSDIEKQGADASPAELEANRAAATFSIPHGELEDFIARVSPYFSEVKVCGFAQRIGVHPGIVVGQLQRKLGRHDLMRRFQVKIRSFATAAGDPDGWDSISRV